MKSTYPTAVGPGVPPTMADPRAACRNEDPNLFYPDRYVEDMVADAKRICAGCPLRLKCLEWALLHERYGVQGGMTPIERGALGGVTYSDEKYRKAAA